MMDGRNRKIRNHLDKNNKEETLNNVVCNKIFFKFIWPFRSAVSAASELGPEKKTYQMNYGNINEALKEASLDIKEGTDILLIKPGIMYLDVLREVKILLNIQLLVIKFQENTPC